MIFAMEQTNLEDPKVGIFIYLGDVWWQEKHIVYDVGVVFFDKLDD
jgi:hypothetical protein